MTTSGIQGQRLEINVIGCRSLKDKEWLTRQDPYVVIEYANSKFRTRTDTDGGKNPSFNEKYTLPLIEGLREVNVQVWNSNSITYDDLIGTGRIQLEKALSTGYDDSTWCLISKSGKYAGEIRMILHYAHAKSDHQASAPAPPVNYAAPPPAAPHAGYHSAPQYATSAYSAYPSGYPPAHAPAGYPPAHSPAGYPPQVASHVYPPHPAAPYPPPAAPYQLPYPPSAYPPSSGPGYWPPSGAYPPYPGGHPGYPSY